MPEHVRIGIIGTSAWADLSHLPNLKSHPGAEVLAICGRNRARAQGIANKYEIPNVFTDYREMIEKGDLQALIIAAPDDVHHQMAMEALDAGLHVMCEKPLALNVNQAIEMYEKAETVGVKHMTSFTFRWTPHFQYLKELIDDDYLGRPFQCNIRYLSGDGFQKRYAWRYDRNRSNGALGNIGSHMIDFARWFVGDIVKVGAHMTNFVDRPGPQGEDYQPANDSAQLVLEFENGAQGSIQISAVAHTGERGQKQEVILHGESGTLEVDFSLGSAEIRGARRDEGEYRTLYVPDRLWGDVDRNQSLIGQLIELYTKGSVGNRLFIDAILEDKPISPSFYEGFKVQEVIDAANESHRNGGWVTIQ